MTEHLDLTGLRCPLPVIRLEAAMRRAAPGAFLTVEADDPLARVDIPHAAQSAGFTCEDVTPEGKTSFVFRIMAPRQ